MLCADGPPGIVGMCPTLCVNVPAQVILREIISEHGGMATGQLPPMVTDAASAVVTDAASAVATAPTEPPEKYEEEVDEDGVKWAAACIPPSDSTSEETTAGSPTATVHLGAMPPPPPLMRETLSPIGRIQENF